MAELAWLLGTALCAFGVVLCTKANLGLSMMAAPPYIVHVTLVKYFPWYSQGTSEYVWQTALLLLTCLLVRKFRFKYLLSFATGFLFGMMIDGWLFVLGGSASYGSLAARIAALLFGQTCIALSVAMVFKSYMPAQMPECLVMEVSAHFGIAQTKIKQINDISCLVLSFALALFLTGGFNGVGVGTIVITLINAPLIQLWGKVLDKFFEFDPMFPTLKKWIG